MYSLDVNFLKDRHLDASKTTIASKKSAAPSLKQQLPIIIGGSVALVLPALAATSLLLISQLTSQTEQNIAELDQQLGALNAQNQRLKEIDTKIEQTNQEMQGLVSVFNQIKPWSALMKEIERQTPPGVQIGLIQQEGPGITISGFAVNYDALNDFLLTLQSSSWLKADQTKIIEATLADLPIEVQNAAENVTITVPQGVKYAIATQLTDRPSTELTAELSRNGAAGLITRLQTLKRQGAIQP